MEQPTLRKEQIYFAAGGLFSRKGYHATSVRDIARELNLQGGSLYAHIESKEDVLWEIVQRAASEFLQQVAPIADERAPAPDRLRRMIVEHIRIVTDRLEDATVFFHEWRFLAPERRDCITLRRDEYEAAFRRVIEEGVARSEFRAVDPRLTAVAVLSTVNGVYQWYRPDGPLSPTQIAESFAELFLHGLQAQHTGG